jgi:hypothetical protein
MNSHKFEDTDRYIRGYPDKLRFLFKNMELNEMGFVGSLMWCDGANCEGSFWHGFLQFNIRGFFSSAEYSSSTF